jgi:hypothetical protein
MKGTILTLKNIRETGPTQWNLTSQSLFYIIFSQEVFNILKDILAEGTKADLVEGVF